MISNYVSSVFKICRVLFSVVGDNSNEFVDEDMIGERDRDSRVKGFWLGRIGEIGVSRLKDGVGLVFIQGERNSGVGLVLIQGERNRVRLGGSFIIFMGSVVWVG